MTESTSAHQRPAHLWRPGQSGNPAGRPKGSRNKLAEDFVAALYDDFDLYGAAAIAACRASSPETYVRVIASLVPKDVHISGTVVHEQALAEIVERLRVLDAKTIDCDVQVIEDN
jgi:hypothetical protein